MICLISSKIPAVKKSPPQELYAYYSFKQYSRYVKVRHVTYS